MRPNVVYRAPRCLSSSPRHHMRHGFMRNKLSPFEALHMFFIAYVPSPCMLSMLSHHCAQRETF